MKLIWYGHSCFKVICENGTVVFDPYAPGSVPGLELPELKADAVICSHGHSDHCAPERIILSGHKPEMKLRQIETFHDSKHGELRGRNLVSVISSEGMNLAHLGDLGHELSGTQLEELGSIDVLLIPIGGYYTIDAAQAKRITDAVKPRIIVPMHYRRGAQGIQQVCGVDRFLELFRSADIKVLSRHSLEITADTEPGVYVFPWPELLYSRETQSE